jgi:hypothetical protein
MHKTMEHRCNNLLLIHEVGKNYYHFSSTLPQFLSTLNMRISQYIQSVYYIIMVNPSFRTFTRLAYLSKQNTLILLLYTNHNCYCTTLEK